GDSELTYRELDARADQFAAALVGWDVGPESVVAVVMHRSVDLIAALLGVVKAGGAYLPIDPDYPAERIAFMLADSGAVGVVTSRPCAPTTDLPLLHAEELAAGHFTPRPVSPAHPAYVIYTSGSTGTPKGVVVTHRGLESLIAGQGMRFA